MSSEDTTAASGDGLLLACGRRNLSSWEEVQASNISWKECSVRMNSSAEHRATRRVLQMSQRLLWWKTARSREHCSHLKII